MTVHESPVAGREGAGVGAEALLRVEPALSAVIAHPIDVSPAGGVGLGRHPAAVGVLAHADHVGRHHPGETVDERRGEPFVERPGLVAPLQGVVAEHHQALDVVGPAAVAHPGQGLAQALRRDRLRVQPGPPVRQRRVGVQGIAVEIVRTEVPVEMPDVLPPAQNLPDEPLDRRQRRRTVPIGLLGGAHSVQRVQDPQVQRHRQQGMRHGPVGSHHRVLVAAEVGEPVGDEVRQRGVGLRGGHREQSRSVRPDGVQAHPVEVAADLIVDLVLDGGVGGRHTEGSGAARR